MTGKLEPHLYNMECCVDFCQQVKQGRGVTLMEVMMAQHPWRMATPPTSRAPAHRPLCSLTGRPLTSQAGCPRQLPQPLPL